MIAAMNSNIECCVLLLKHGGDPDHTDSEGQSAIDVGWGGGLSSAHTPQDATYLLNGPTGVTKAPFRKCFNCLHMHRILRRVAPFES